MWARIVFVIGAPTLLYFCSGLLKRKNEDASKGKRLAVVLALALVSTGLLLIEPIVDRMMGSPVEEFLDSNATQFTELSIETVSHSAIEPTAPAITETTSSNSTIPSTEAKLDETLLPTTDVIESIMPVSLSTMALIDSSGWSVNEGEPMDNFGNTHYSSYTSVIYNSSSMFSANGYYAEYRVYSQYSTLTGTVSNYQEIESGTLRIYADDILLRTYTIGKKTDPINFSLDITGADYIKFEVDLSCRSGIILSNVCLSNLGATGEDTYSTPAPPPGSISPNGPVSLLQQTLVGSNNWSVNEGEPMDNFGNTHYSSYTSVIYNSNSMFRANGYYAEYRVYSQYSTLTGTVSNYQEIESGTLRIYTDDILLRTYTIGKKTDPINFSLDITGADYIKFEVDLSCRSGIILSDVELS